jgi:hypothetical protein
MFEKITVIPLYIAVLKITDSQKGLTWEQQVYFGTNYAKAHEAAINAAREDWPGSVTELTPVIKYYHLQADGRMSYIDEKSPYANTTRTSCLGDHVDPEEIMPDMKW